MVILVKRWFFVATCMGPLIVIRERDYHVTVLNHEYIHSRQQLEMGYVFAYLLYGLELICKLAYYRNLKKAYLNISFEREAYLYQHTIGYCAYRKPYQHLRLIYLKNKKPVK